jgi:hypothetical protein
MRTETPNLDLVLDDIEKLRRGVQLLEMLWGTLGPYQNFPKPDQHEEDLAKLKSAFDDGELDRDRYNLLVRELLNENPNNVWSKIGDYFDFDDSE